MSHNHQDNKCPSCGKIDRCRCMKPKDTPMTTTLCKDCVGTVTVPALPVMPIMPVPNPNYAIGREPSDKEDQRLYYLPYDGPITRVIYGDKIEVFVSEDLFDRLDIYEDRERLVNELTHEIEQLETRLDESVQEQRIRELEKCIVENAIKENKK